VLFFFDGVSFDCHFTLHVILISNLSSICTPAVGALNNDRNVVYWLRRLCFYF
jgi:hypothetical protein